MPVALTGNGFSKYAFYMKNKWKLLIDLIMVFVFVTLYDKHAISLEYHEIAGFAVLGIALVHLALNWRWVVGTTKTFSGEPVPHGFASCIRLTFFSLSRSS